MVFIENITTRVIEHNFNGADSFQDLMMFEIDRKIENVLAQILTKRVEVNADVWYNEPE